MPTVWRDDWPEPKERLRRPKHGVDTELTAVLKTLEKRNPYRAVGEMLARYPWRSFVDTEQFVIAGQAQLEAKNPANAERLAYEFIRESLASRPDDGRPEPYRPWWRRWRIR